MKVKHTLKPIYNKDSYILILGSIPSITSRKKDFYYSHKQNRFWKIINILFNTNLNTKEEKKEFLLNNNIALYDIIKECTINNSSDSSIKNIKIMNLLPILNNSKIKYIFCEGRLSYNLFQKHYSNLPVEFFYLPSTSSANASYNLDKLLNIYNIIKEKLDTKNT